MSDERRRASALRPGIGSWALVLVALAAVSGIAHAQDGQDDASGTDEYEPDQRGGHEDPGEPDPTYEPDQRGGHEDPSEPDPTYEPDQRGGHEEADVERIALAPGAAASETMSFGRGPRLEVELALGLGVTGLEIAGQNLTPPGEQGALGPSVGLALGVRSGPVLFGPRVALVVDPNFLLTHVALGADVELLEGELVPFVRVALGVTFVTPFGDALSSSGLIAGLGGELGGGLRGNLGRGFVIGGELALGWHHLWRAGVPGCTDGCGDGGFDLRRAGESDALSLRISILAGYRF